MGFFLRWWFAGGLWLLMSAAAATEPLRVVVAPDQVVSVTQVDMALEEYRPGSTAPGWSRQKLPDAWSVSRPRFGGTVNYRFLLRYPDAAPKQPIALSIPRASMDVQLWFNGIRVGRDGAWPQERPPVRLWNTPLLYVLPDAHWQPGDNLLHLQVTAEHNQGGGLSAFRLGPEDRLRADHEWRLWWQNRLVSALNVFVVSLGAFFLMLWGRHPTQRHYGYFGAAAILMALSNVNMVVTSIPVSGGDWELLVHLLLLWGPLLLALFPLGFARLHQPMVERVTLGFGALVTALLLAERGQAWLSWWAAAMLPVLVLDGVAIVWLLRYVRREQPLLDNLLLCVAGFGALGLGAHDVMVRLGWLPFDQPYASPYMTPLLMSALCWLVAGDYARSQQWLSNANRELAQRLAQRERELQTSFERLTETERERAATAERSRILRDMHDGVGAHITTAMRQLETGHAEPALVAQTLRDSLDQLKLSIDAMNLPSGDVNALLASLRYRLQRRIESAGLALHWAVEALPLWPAGQADAIAMRHLQYIVFEAISNALQHAHATELTLGAEMTVDQDAIRISLSDNGRGLSGDPAKALHTMRERACLLRISLQVEVTAAGTRVVLSLPLSAPGADPGAERQPRVLREGEHHDAADAALPEADDDPAGHLPPSRAGSLPTPPFPCAQSPAPGPDPPPAAP